MDIPARVRTAIYGALSCLGIVVIIFLLWQATKQVPTEGDWQTPLSRLSAAEFNGDSVTVRNVRNFRYNGSENESDLVPDYYDRTYDLSKLSRVWYVAEPFKELSVAAHTFLSFEFSDGNYLSISIEARKRKGQDYKLSLGLLRTYPLMYIAADERDALLVRANTRKDDVYLYPVRTTPEKGRQLLVGMLERMNSLIERPEWYNTLTANCTSLIAEHINQVTPGRIPDRPWQGYVTGYADAFAIEQGLLDTDLPLEQARAKHRITDISQEIGDVPDYSSRIRR
jgi:hypothetical protein